MPLVSTARQRVLVVIAVFGSSVGCIWLDEVAGMTVRVAADGYDAVRTIRADARTLSSGVPGGGRVASCPAPLRWSSISVF